MGVVFIVDDDDMLANNCALHVEDLELVPRIINGIPSDIRTFMEEIRRERGYLICDQRLSGRVTTQHRGSDFAIAAYEAMIPSILTTAHLEQELPYLRRLQRKMPAVLSRKGLRDVDLRAVFAQCELEFTKGLPERRQPYRVLVRVTKVYPESNLAEVLVPTWDAEQNVVISIAGLSVSEGTRFFSNVNLGAEQAQDLYFDGFETAMTPDEGDGLA